MFYKRIRQWAGSHWNNIPGWRTNRKIVVFESDDWGSIRMPSKKVYDQLLNRGIRVDKCEFSKYDSLESEDDLNYLFDILLKYKDKNGKNPVITANTVMANPDFIKIKESGFKNYYYELFTDTLRKYPNHQNAFNLWKVGIEKKIFHPQLHGREHLNFARWLRYLSEKSSETLSGFEYEMFGISTNVSNENRRSYMAALDFENKNELAENCKTLLEAQFLFNQIFGYKSKSFIAPNYIWSPEHEKELAMLGVKYIQGGKNQILPLGDNSNIKYLRHSLGDKNQYGQIYLVRNCYFEPSSMPEKDIVSSCLKQIRTIFFWGKPAIISTHRLNFIGSINKRNRELSLNKFNTLLHGIISKWPDVEFMTSDQLGEEIEKNNT